MTNKKMKVVILCGGRGTRLHEETGVRPKPLVEIGHRPILWHIMKTYAYYGYKDFVLCLGYKGEMIKEYFLNYGAMNSDFTVHLGVKQAVTFHSGHLEEGWNVTLVDTGLEAQTGARVKRVEKYIDSETFLLTYGDGVADIDLAALIKHHFKSKKIGTITGVHPSSRFGELVVRNGEIAEFNEKPQVKQGFINGGFFVFNKKIFDYLENRDDCLLEKKPLEKLSTKNQLAVYLHDGFWQCMDTQRELDILNELYKTNRAPWVVWKR